MRHAMLPLAAVILLACVSTHAAESPSRSSSASSDDSVLTALRTLTLDAGTFTVERDESPTFTSPDGQTFSKLPPRTIVKATLTPVPGSHIGVELWLPDNAQWNGKFLGWGNGGAAGKIHPERFPDPLKEGFAVANTDVGTAPNADSGVGNPEVWKDFGFRATHLMTVFAKQAIVAAYGRAPELSYFYGSSTGGQQALAEAQRYPEDYDGIVAAIPAHCRTPLHAYFLWNDQILKKCPFTATQEAAVIAAGNDTMAAKEIPLAAHHFVSDPRRTSADIDAVIALALRKDPTLTPQHAEALRRLFDGPRHSVTGERIFDGLPFGSALTPARANLYLFKWVFGAKKNLDDINFGADFDTYTAALAPYLNAENPDLSAFEKRGGKILMTSGSVDSVVPPQATIDYYERVIERTGSLEKTQAFYRFYLVPGMAHGGGTGVNQSPNLLEPLRRWREKGIAPESLEGRRVVEGKTVFTLPLYPYPAKTGWDEGTNAFKSVDGQRGGVASVAERFRPPAAQ
jgi:feruloyl esterase